jgi:hypothetical protein
MGIGSSRLVLGQVSAARFEVGAEAASARSGEFDSTDLGFGGRVAWLPHDAISIEAELNLYPGDFPDEPGFSGGRLEGLFGVAAGPRFGRVKPFAKLRPGFLRYDEAERPIACILIFPPPLSCTLAAGRTVFALDVGGGIDIAAASNAFVRVDAGDRLVRYPGPVLDGERRAHDDAFFGHDFRLAVGAGVRF